jgi:hypothetical protein
MNKQQVNNIEPDDEPLPTFQERIQKTYKNIKIGDPVRFIQDGKIRHEGTVIYLTDSFARIYRPKKNNDDISGDISPDSAELFPIENKFGGIVIV